jgi:hypothetical protein
MEKARAARWKKMDAARVAKVGYVALKKGRVMVIPSVVNSLGIFSFRFLPRKLVARINRSLM